MVKNAPLVELDINEWDFATRLLDNCYFLVFGKRRSGKTTMMRLIAQHTPFAKKYQHIVIVGSQELRELWATVVHDFYIHDGNDTTNILQEIIDETQRRIQVCKYYGVPYPPEWEVVLFVDDCGSYTHFMKSPAMKWLAAQGRNSHITLFVMVQKLTQADKGCREGADGVMALYSAFFDSIKTLHKEFASMIPFPRFMDILGGCTQNKGMLVIDAHAATPQPKDMFGVSHADLLHKDGFKGALEHVGSPDHWAYAEENYKPPPAPKLFATGTTLPSINATAINEQQQQQEQQTNVAKHVVSSNEKLSHMPSEQEEKHNDEESDNDSDSDQHHTLGLKPIPHFNDRSVPVGSLVLNFIRKSSSRSAVAG